MRSSEQRGPPTRARRWARGASATLTDGSSLGPRRRRACGNPARVIDKKDEEPVHSEASPIPWGTNRRSLRVCGLAAADQPAPWGGRLHGNTRAVPPLHPARERDGGDRHHGRRPRPLVRLEATHASEERRAGDRCRRRTSELTAGGRAAGTDRRPISMTSGVAAQPPAQIGRPARIRGITIPSSLQLQRVPVGAVLLTMVASGIGIGWSILDSFPFYGVVAMGLLPWIPLFFFEAAWKYENYGFYAILGTFTVLQLGHLDRKSTRLN